MSATAVVNEVELLIPMAGLIDKDAELSRLQKELKKLEKEIHFIEEKLSNPSFTAKAPEAVIAKDKDRLQQAQTAHQKLHEQYQQIEAL